MTLLNALDQDSKSSFAQSRARARRARVSVVAVGRIIPNSLAIEVLHAKNKTGTVLVDCGHP
jgi:hypothetical protein